MRAQLSLPNLKLLTPELYNQIFTMHGTTMIFLVVMPVLTGFGIYLVPLMIGARDMAFPRLNAVAFWLQVGGGLLLYFSFATGHAPDRGLVQLCAAERKALLAGTGARFLGDRAAADRGEHHRVGDQFHRHHRHLRAPGHDHPAAAAVRLDEPGELGDDLFALPALAAALVMLLTTACCTRISSIRRRADRRCFGSITSGSSATRRSTSWCFRRSG